MSGKQNSEINENINENQTPTGNSGGPTPKSFSRFVGTIMVPAGWVGIVFLLLIMLLIPLGGNFTFNRAGTIASESAFIILDLADTLDNTASAVESAGEIVENTSNTIDSITESLNVAAPFLRSTGELIGENAPKTIESTNEALKSAQTGAQAIDGVLRALSSVSFLTGLQYNPERSLSESIEETSTSLEPLPDQLRDIQVMLEGFAETIEGTRPDLEDTDSELDTIGGNLSDLASSLVDEAEDLRALAAFLNQLVSLLSLWKWGFIIFLEISVLWFIFGQVTIIYVGRSLKSGSTHGSIGGEQLPD